MSLKLTANSREIEVVYSTFPAGETCLRITDHTYHDDDVHLRIKLHFQGNSDLIDLAMLVDACRRHYPFIRSICLDMPYLPYARQDRVCNAGESLSVKVVADFINSLKFTSVHCKDIHSAVGEALIDNLYHVDQKWTAYVLGQTMASKGVILVSPDAGANKKVLEFAKNWKFSEVVRADKVRNVLTGAIESTKVYSEHVGDKDFLILDDLIDGGKTFTELAKELRKLTTGKIYLFATHGIFSKGMDVFDGLIDKIYVSNLMGKEHPLIEVI